MKLSIILPLAFLFAANAAALASETAPPCACGCTDPRDCTCPKTAAKVYLDDYIVETCSTTLRLKAPSVTHQLVREDLEALNLPETGDAVQYLPNLFIRKRFVGDKNSLTSIRGTSNRQPGRTLVVADGIVLSNFLGTGFGNSPRWFLVAPEEIEKIAVSYGPYSALYTGNSIGGTVLFTTQMPTRLTATAKAHYFVENFSEYATRDTFAGKTGYVSYGDRRGKFSWFAFINHLDNDSQPMTFATVNNSATTAPGTGGTAVTGALTDTDFSANARIIYGSQGPTEAVHDTYKLKLGYDFSDDTHLRYSVMYWVNSEDNLAPETYLRDAAGNPVWSGKVEAAGRTFTITPTTFNVNVRGQRDLIQGFTFSHEPATGPQFTVTGSLYDVLKDKTYAANTALPSADTGGAGRATLIGDTGWKTLDAILGWRNPVGAIAHSPLLGYHYDTYFTQQDQRNMTNWRDASTVTSLISGNGGTTVIHSLFAQDTWRLAERWTLTPGLRWETWEAKDGYQASSAASGPYAARTNSAWSPKLALAWKPAPGWNARLSLAKATRFPTVGELFQGTVSASGSVTQNNPDLEPERDFAKDLTIERTLPKGTARFSLFEEDVTDSLVNQSTLRADGTSLSGPQNVGRVLTRGAEFAVQQRGFLAESLSLDFNASYTNAVIKENAPILVAGVPTNTVGKQFPRIPHWQVKSVLSWRATSDVSLSAAARYSSYQYNTLENSDPYGGYGGTDAFFVVDLKATYRLPRGLRASLGVSNVNDDRYHVFHPMPGRTWLAEFDWSL
ncbi:MAG TPA: TonB-dependent receptor [Lacunisphaera sp.]|nr:TonB-dependent receptor [Lacunisphaera sp.]